MRVQSKRNRLILFLLLSAIAVFSTFATRTKWVELYPLELSMEDQKRVVPLLRGADFAFELDQGRLIIDARQKHEAQALVLRSGLALEPIEQICACENLYRDYREEMTLSELNESMQKTVSLVPELRESKLLQPARALNQEFEEPVVLQLNGESELSPELLEGVKSFLETHDLDSERLEVRR